jgi:hypothetical protein
MMGLKLRPHGRQLALESTKPSIADRFADVITRVQLEHALEPDVLEAAEDVLRVFRAKEKKRADADPEADLPPTVSRAFRRSEPLS